jgi:CubicO group peptidase (beta-lactamase class C family)
MSWAYSNDGYALLGQLVEDVTGEAFADAVRRSVLDPLGMHSTDFSLSERVGGAPFTGYDVQFDSVQASPQFEVGVPAAGSARSTLTDMVRYAAALSTGAVTPVLPALAYRQLLRPRLSVPDRPGTSMGLGFVLTQRGEHPVAWHNGGWPGATSELWVAPSARRAVLLFANCHDHLPPRALDQLADDLLAVALTL